MGQAGTSERFETPDEPKSRESSVSPSGAGASRPTRDSVGKLQEERTRIEASLDPDKRKRLEDYRIAASSSDNPTELARYRKLIDEIDPRLARLNGEIRDGLRSLSPRADEGGRLRPGLPQLVLIEGQQAMTGPAERLERQDADWYAPFARAHGFAKSHGLEIEYEQVGDRRQPKFFVRHGDEKVYFPMDTSKDLDKELARAIEMHCAEMEKKYNIHILRPGQTIAEVDLSSTNHKDNAGRAQHIPARAPYPYEVAALESALKLVEPSLDGPKVDFCFLSQALRKDEEMPRGQFWKDVNGGPNIGIFEREGIDLSAKGPSTELVREMRDTMLHEFEHHSQHRTALENDDQRLSRLGWIKLPTHPTNDGKTPQAEYVMKGKEGTNFRYSYDEKTWYRCDDKGDPVNRKAEPVKVRQARVSVVTVMREAQVRSVTTYCHNPLEQGAEATMYFKGGASKRAELLLSGEALYRETKDADQREIDAFYQKHHPEERGIRLPDGRVVSRTKEAEAQVAAFESMFVERDHLSDTSSRVADRLFDVHHENERSNWTNPKSEAELEMLLASLDKAKPEAEAAQRLLERIKGSPLEKDLSQLVDSKEDSLKSYKELNAEAITEYAILELRLGNVEKARELMQKATQTGVPIKLDLNGGGFTDDQISALVDGLPNIESIRIENNDAITDRTIEKLASLKSLKSVALSSVPSLTDESIRQLQNCRQLERLSISNMNISPSALTILSGLSHFRSLEIANMPVGSAVIDILQKTPKLTDLTLRGTGVKEEDFAKIANLTQLKTLDIDDHSGSDRAIRSIRNLSNLETLSLRGIKLSGQGISSALELPHLKNLNLAGTSITSDDLDRLKGTHLTSLVISSTKSIPPTRIEAVMKWMPATIAVIAGDEPMPLGSLPVPRKYVP